MVHDASWPLEGLLAAWVSSVLYGMNVIATVAYVRIALRKSLKATSHRILLAIALVQFVLATIHVAVCLRSAIDGLIHSIHPVAYFEDQGNPMHLTQTIAYSTNSLIADAILAWRLYVVWGKRRWILIPFILMICGAAVCNYAAVGELADHHNVQLLYANLVKQWAVATWSLSISIQVSATLLIARKLWSVHSESLLSTTTIFLLAFYVNKLAAGGIIVAMLGQLATLVPTSILVRVTIANKVATQSSLDSPGLSSDGTPRRNRDLNVDFAAKTGSDITTYGSQREV